MTLTAVSLFAGVEGIGLALTRAGVHVVAAVEIDPAARGVIADQYPDVALYDDVTKVTGDQLIAAGFIPGRGILAGGWPCQGNSVAGARGGMADPRSGLWTHIVRLLAETRAAWFLGENVPGLLSVNDGADFGTILGDLADLGMGLCWRVLDAQHFGVPQRRRRVFIVGHLGDRTGPVQVLLEPEGSNRDPAARDTAGTGVAWGAAPRVAGPVPCLTARYGKGTDSDATDPLVVGSLTSPAGGWRVGADEAVGGHIIVREVVAALTSSGVGTCGPDDNQAQAGHLVSVTGPVTHALTSYAAGRATEDGTGRGSPIIAITGTVTHALTSEGADASEDGTGRGTPIIYQSHGSNVGPLGTLTAGNGAVQGDVPFKLEGTTVRRLTPVECERLQGFPDDWTATSNGRPQADSARYRQMGNAVAVPVVEWIARRIVAVDTAQNEAEDAA